MVARINNTVSTRGQVVSIQLHFDRAEESGLYLTNEEYAMILHYVAPRVFQGAPVVELRRCVDVLSQLMEVNRLDLVMALLDEPLLIKLGIHAEAEFEIATTGHGEVTNARLLVKNFEF